MADNSLNGLTAATSAAASDLIYLLRTPFTSGYDRKITFSNFEASLSAMVGDSGTGGTKGVVPAPGAGDAGAGKYLKASGVWDVPSGAGTGDVTGPSLATADGIAVYNGTTGKIIKNGSATIAQLSPVAGSSSIVTTGTLTGGATGAGFTVALGTSTITGILTSAYGGTGNGFTKFSGPTTAEKTMTLPDADATLARTDAGQTFTGVNIFTSPKIITDISDTNGCELIKFTATGTAVNEITIENAATGTTGPKIAASGETNVDLRLSGKGTGKVHVVSGSYGDVTAYTPAGAGTATIACKTSNFHSITMPAGNITIAFADDAVGQCFVIDIIQDAGGSRTVTWPAGIKWPAGSAPTLTTTATKIDTIGIRVVTAGSAYYGYIIAQNL